MVNKVILIGNLGKDPEMKTTQGGTAVLSFSLATQDSRKNKSGEWEKVTDWHNVTMFGNTAEHANSWLKKGSKVYIEGKIKTDSWEDNEGNKKYKTYILASSFKNLSPREEGAAVQSNSTLEPVEGGDLPF